MAADGVPAGMRPSRRAMILSSSMMAAMSMPWGQRAVHVSQPVHSQMNLSSKTMSSCPSCTARMIIAGCISEYSATGQPLVQRLHW